VSLKMLPYPDGSFPRNSQSSISASSLVFNGTRAATFTIASRIIQRSRQQPTLGSRASSAGSVGLSGLPYTVLRMRRSRCRWAAWLEEPRLCLHCSNGGMRPPLPC